MRRCAGTRRRGRGGRAGTPQARREDKTETHAEDWGAQMPHSVAPSQDGSYVILTVVGTIPTTEMLGYILEAHALGRELHLSRYLVDASESRNANSPAENYAFARRGVGAQEGIDKSARVAALVSPDDHSHDFIETALRNAGYDFTLFRDREQAVRHLTG